MNINGIEYVKADYAEELESKLKDANRKIEQLIVFVSVLVPADDRIYKALDEWMERLTKKFDDVRYFDNIMGRNKALKFLDGLGALDGSEKTDMLREIADLKSKLDGANVKIGKLEAGIGKVKAGKFPKTDLAAFRRAEKTLCKIIEAMEEREEYDSERQGEI